MTIGNGSTAALAILVKEIGLLPLGVVMILLLFPCAVTGYLLYKLDSTLERMVLSSERNTDVLKDILQEVK